ncbi:hypothetical protein L1987_35083 [Smallanthus sonchifolius]|uniref:Uncharacterized protein n=1 Tax=Smallanthus sonchifolius TaxID=185202 RepID=A0ACB9HX08_9ASTR|nr:hypothetical protein L1987_35083 [Smallanthus sonchifolius]
MNTSSSYPFVCVFKRDGFLLVKFFMISILKQQLHIPFRSPEKDVCSFSVIFNSDSNLRSHATSHLTGTRKYYYTETKKISLVTVNMRAVSRASKRE